MAYTKEQTEKIMRRAREIIAEGPAQDAAFARWRAGHRDEIEAADTEALLLRAKRFNMPVIHKVSAKPGDGSLEFILSTEDRDSLGDIIELKGWMLDTFRKNPIALMGHQQSFVVGVWDNVSVRGNALRGHLRLASASTSERIREVVKLVEENIIRSVSVGFRAHASTPIEGGGLRFTKSELIECSLCAIGANSNALAVARSMVSPETVSAVFGNGVPETALDVAIDEIGRTTGNMQAQIDALRNEIKRKK
jgi:HK97 family phage prohead protease